MRVDIYSDVACPWCYIGKRRFERAWAAFPGAAEVEVRYHPFQLDPQAPTTAIRLMDMLHRKFGPQAKSMTRRVTEAAQAEGIKMNWDKALSVNTMLAQRLIWLAERDANLPTQYTIVERLFAGYFTDGVDLSAPEALAIIAGSAGMDAKHVLRCLIQGEGIEEVQAGLAQAQQLGITAVPTFVFEDRHGLQGAQPPTAFLDLFKSMAAKTASGPKPPPRASAPAAAAAKPKAAAAPAAAPKAAPPAGPKPAGATATAKPIAIQKPKPGTANRGN